MYSYPHVQMYVCTYTHTHECMHACIPVLKMIKSCLWATTSCTTGTDLSMRREKWPSEARTTRRTHTYCGQESMHDTHIYHTIRTQTDRHTPLYSKNVPSAGVATTIMLSSEGQNTNQ